MTSGSIRRSQLIAPFGPGAMQVLADGTSVITAGLDHWFRDTDNVDYKEFRIHEWRLEDHLGVGALYAPPDYRDPGRNPEQYNTNLTVPVLRFPAWSFCPKCRALTRHPLHHTRRSQCEGDCAKLNPRRAPLLSQVPFVALCEQGHLQDFPWEEWVHGSTNPDCRSKLVLRTSGGGTLESQRVACEKCGQARTLAGITSVESGTADTYLTTRLDKKEDFLCQGGRPWLGLERGDDCTAQLRGSLRNATNVYYSLVKSAIFLPESSSDEVSSEVWDALEERTIKWVRDTLRSVLEEDEKLTARKLRRAAKKNAFKLEKFTDEQIDAALAVLENGQPSSAAPADEAPKSQAPFRKQEYDRIRDSVESAELVVRPPAEGNLDAESLISRVRLVEKLRETRVLWGFNRVYAESRATDEAERMSLLRRTSVSAEESWLPAYTVLGEGIYLELDPDRLAQWENDPAVQGRVRPLAVQFSSVAAERQLAERDIAPRLVLLHTLAHLLINQLTYECGYSSASLRERLYATPGDNGMNGILIYTAAGDSEGTLGGLVRMGEPDRFQEVLKNAVANARWCSSDPVCMETGAQGPDSCNLAACHSCALLPETACEEFNRFLDRGLVVGTLDDEQVGFFSSFA
ncbi:DUF1998 domain-containing protein [Saccharopolyspora shandongensis]|uniref:DUF1998 domain-containing protein n=1 Tax=Saccharopolyspora shandongensis TaxID=418495 RepID=UPI0033CC3E49